VANNNHHAIVIGIRDYGSLKPRLEGPEADADAFIHWLESADGGHVPAKNIRSVLSSSFDNSKLADAFGYQPNFTAMRRPFFELMALTAANSMQVPRVGARLYIYLSGHGITPRIDPTTGTNQSGLLAADCLENVNYDSVAGHAYAEWFRLSHAFDEILLFMDCCRTDRPEVPPAVITTPIVLGGRPDDVRVFYAWATQWDSRSWEQQLGTPPRSRGVFTFALLEALSKGPADAQGRLTTEGVVGYLAVRVPALRQDAEAQAPKFFPPEPDGRFVIVPRVKAIQSNVTVTFDQALFGQAVDLQDGGFASVFPEPHTASADTWSLRLKPGLYQLVIGGKEIVLIVKPDQATEQHVDG
jgi:hypothetical protein